MGFTFGPHLCEPLPWSRAQGYDCDNRSQIENLTPNHKSFKSRGQMSSDWGMIYTIEKIFSRPIKYCPSTLKKKLDLIKI
jgi:hypothetical protein